MYGATTIGRRYILIVATLLALLAGGCRGRGTKSKSLPIDALQCITLSDSLRVDTLDFGKVRSGEILERKIALHNASSAPILIVTTDTSCGCLELDYQRKPLEAGEKAEATMRFFSSGYNYFVPRAFYIVTSASMAPKKLIVTADIQ